MKRIILLINAFIIVISAIAQEELKVKSFLPSVNDLTARIEVRNDNGGEPCALVKVVLADKNVSFECGNLASMIIGDVTFHTNEYWVYLAAGDDGAKHLKVRHPKYPTIGVTFSEYGFKTLEPQTTYTLVLQMPKEVNLEYKYNRLGATLSSLVVPGLGQMAFKKSTTKGVIILAGEILSIGGIFICNSQSDTWKNKSNMAISASEKKDFMAKSDSWANGRNICIGAAAAIWSYNMVDVLFAKKKVKKTNELSLKPYLDIENNYGINLTYNF